MNDPYSYKTLVNKPMPRARLPIHRVRDSDEDDSVSFTKSEALLTKKSPQFSPPLAYERTHSSSDESFSEDADVDVLELSESYRSADNSFRLKSAQTSYSSNGYGSPSSAKNTSSSHTPKKNCNNSMHKVVLPLCILVMVILAVSVGAPESWNKINAKGVKHKRINDAEEADVKINELMEEVRGMFPNQRREIWNDISSGLYNIILYPEKPLIIMLFSSNTETMTCLAQLLGQVSSKVLGTNKYLTLMPDDFGTDPGEAIYNLKQQISQTKVAVVQNLLSVNADAIKVFHNLCDRENPLVREVVYIITMSVGEYNGKQTELEFVENQIKERLAGKISIDILDPLIVRITDGLVISVEPDVITEDCSLSL